MEDLKQDYMRSRSRSPVRRSSSRSRSPSPKRNKNGRQRPFMGGRRIIVRNIPYEVKWQELKDMFRKGVGDVTYVEMLETPEGKSRGVAVVEFREAQHAEKAIEDFHQKKIKERAIIVREEREKDRQEFAQNKNINERGRMGGMGGPQMGGGGLGQVGLPAGVNPQILQQLGIEPPISSTVFVANLDYSVTWWKLKDVFKLAGNVIKAEIKEDKNGKSRGMGVVIFEHPMEAVQAVSMFNGQLLYERNMIVRVDKGGEQDKPRLPSGLKSIGMGLGSGGAPLTNIGQLGGGLGMGGGGLLGMGGLGGGGLGGGGLGGSGLGLLGAGGNDMGLGMGGLGGGLGSGLGGLGLGGSGGHHGGGSDRMGFSMSDLGLGGLGGSKMGGLSDNYHGLGGSNYNGSSGLSGLGGLGPSLSSLSAGLGGSGDRLGDGVGLGRDRLGIDRLGGLGDRLGGLGDRMGGLGDRMGGMGDRMGGMGGMGGMGSLSDRMSVLDRIPEKLRDHYGNIGGGGGGGGRDDGNRRTTRADNCTLVAKNLPYSVNWQTLKEHFRDSGDVKFAEIVMDKGKSTGVGYVRFSNENDAMRAVALKHKTRLEGRNISVSMHRN